MDELQYRHHQPSRSASAHSHSQQDHSGSVDTATTVVHLGKPRSRYAQLQHPISAHSFSPKRLWDDTIGHGFTRVSRALKRKSANADSCASHTQKLTKLPKDLLDVTKETGSFYSQHWLLLQREVLCGFAAMLLQIPETIAFSYVANLDPVLGLYCTGFFGIIIGLFGGVPATVAGAAGALAVVMPQLTASSGSLGDLPLNERIEHLIVAITIAGVLQLIFGILGLSKAFSMIPRTAHIGFLNGLALVMFLSQMTTFKVCTDPSLRFGA
ncbi:Sulfate permease [Globisporangium polare]